MCKRRLIIGMLLPTLVGGMTQAAPLGTAFTYEGRLTDGGNVANGHYDLRFSLYAANLGGTPVGGILTNQNIVAVDGLLRTTLDFGAGVFDGTAYWLEIGVRTNGGAASFVTLNPRQSLTPTPYALYANNAGTAAIATTTAANAVTGASIQDFTVTANKIANGQVVKTLNGLTDDVTLSAGANVSLTPSGQTLIVASPTDWHLGGNAGTVEGTDFLGTTDQRALELRVGNVRALRLEPLTLNVIGGWSENGAGLLAQSATIGGGGRPGASNSVNAPDATIAGGSGNTIAFRADNSTIGGGVGNKVNFAGLAPTRAATIAGGESNLVETETWYGTVSGGNLNRIERDNDGGSIGGGLRNRIGEFARAATISGGASNSVGDRAFWATVGGGTQNAVGNQATNATIGGGNGNGVGDGAFGATVSGGSVNRAGGFYATVPGGTENSAAADYTLAAGRRAKAYHPGSFVWGDSTSADIVSSATNEFTARASGGVRFFSDSAASMGVSLAAGSGTWSTISDRNAKANFAPVNHRQVLERLAAIPIQTWNYKSQDASIRHIGPTAQDFAQAFRVGEDDRHITTTDADGVALAAIQGLHADMKEKEAQIKKQKAQIEKLEKQNTALTQSVTELKALMNKLLQKANGGGQ